MLSGLLKWPKKEKLKMGHLALFVPSARRRQNHSKSSKIISTIMIHINIVGRLQGKTPRCAHSEPRGAHPDSPNPQHIFRIQSGDSTLPPKSESNPKPKNQQAFFCCYFCTSGPFVNRDLLISHLRNDHSIINNFSNVFSTCYFKSSVSDHSCDENVS